jgi:putative tricarboxylic transport membrane protein
LALNLPLIGIWVRILDIPRSILYPLILIFTFVGAFSNKNNLFDLWVLLIFGFIGFFAKKYGYPPAPAILAYILGPMMEKSLRRAMAMSHGSVGIFFERPICLILIILIFLVMVLPPAVNLWMMGRKAQGKKSPAPQ